MQKGELIGILINISLSQIHPFYCITPSVFLIPVKDLGRWVSSQIIHDAIEAISAAHVLISPTTLSLPLFLFISLYPSLYLSLVRSWGKRYTVIFAENFVKSIISVSLTTLSYQFSHRLLLPLFSLTNVFVSV